MFFGQWTVKKAWEAKIPHQILHVFSAKEVFVKVVGEIINHVLEGRGGVSVSRVLDEQLGDRAVEQAEVLVVLRKYTREDL